MTKRNTFVSLFALCACTTFFYMAYSYNRGELYTNRSPAVVHKRLREQGEMKTYGQPSTPEITSNALYGSKVEADSQHISILMQRRARLKEQCALMSHQKRDVALDPPEQLIVDEKHRIIYCNVPKVACTNWKTILLKMGGYDHLNTTGKYHLGPNRKGRLYLNYLHEYPNVSQRRFMLQNYTKFLFVRHPFTRVLSAFRSKLAPNISFFFRHGDETEQWVSRYGKKIIEMYRGKAEAKRVSSNWNEEYDLTFAEFVRFLVDPSTDSYNKHWSDINSMCRPCDIDYDVIGKYETLNDDADLVLRIANVDPDITFPKPNFSSATNSSDPRLTERYYEDVPQEMLFKLAMLYAADFELFGYDVESYVQV